MDNPCTQWLNEASWDNITELDKWVHRYLMRRPSLLALIIGPHYWPSLLALQHACFFESTRPWADERPARGPALTLSARSPTNPSVTRLKSPRWRKNARPAALLMRTYSQAGSFTSWSPSFWDVLSLVALVRYVNLQSVCSSFCYQTA